ncbi:DUF1501 domain-containing protein [Anatilimnocola sp. NA78]|uniref:DUF1501 domain-containing protein n=1 Tax=Anatilimnocola sp. NA78 TaxID=3415683 RepID=UPI003CE57C17
MSMSRDQATAWTRRQWLQAGAFGALGLSLPQMLQLQASGASGRVGKAKNVLLLVEHGGLSHVDTWDPKPEVASEQRTPFDLVPTSTPGERFTELLTHTAKISDKIAVVRGMHHIQRNDDHGKGMQYVLSGHSPGGPVEYPDLGAVASYVLGSACEFLPSYVQLPATSEFAHMTKSGFLPTSYGAFKATARDASDPNWKVSGMQRNPELSDERLGQRRALLSALNQNPTLARDRTTAAIDTFHDQAATLLTSPAAAKAFDLSTETPKMREQYGAGHRGACYLLGRKLIESGVRFVTIDTRWPKMPGEVGGGNLNWDHHDHIYAKETCELPGASGAGAGRYGIGHWYMMGSLDRAYSTLITDLEQRGLLDETLVCLVTEFGRTPKINKHGGRDHWPDAYSIVFAGAGIRGGQIIGATDRQGAFVTDNPHSPDDYAATIYDKLGINRDKPLYTQEQRPMFLAHTGKPIAELF